jgi:large subunit ribosomal protein L13
MLALIMDRKWWIVDVEDKVLGRFATKIANVLMGKHRPTYEPHKDEGDFVICVNIGKMRVTGGKENKKIYTRYSGWRGGLTQTLYKREKELHPERIIFHAVHGMMPKNKLNAKRLKRLKVYVGAEHPHKTQKPVKLEV